MATTNERLDVIRRVQGFGGKDTDAFNLYHGINHRGTGDMTPANQDHTAYVFFTKPNCNLTATNIQLVRKLQYLTTTDPDSLAATIKSSLTTAQYAKRYEPGTVRSSVVDDKLPFISFLGTTLLSLTGWPDEVTESFQSAEGMAKQVYGWVDDRPENYGTYDLTATFVNKEGDPHSVLFSAWREYMTRVAEGTMVPYPESLAENSIDYMTRAYVLVTDASKRIVQKIACVGGGMYPTAVPTGAAFNYSSESGMSQENSQIDIPFKAYGVRYNDPVIIDDFNRLGILFNTDMDDSVRERRLKKLSPKEKQIFNNYGYPRINEVTMELEWWVDLEDYNLILTSIGDDENGE